MTCGGFSGETKADERIQNLLTSVVGEITNNIGIYESGTFGVLNKGLIGPETQDDFVNYFISPNYRETIRDITRETDKDFSISFRSNVNHFDYSGLKLKSSYEEVLQFIKKQNLDCQSIKANFHTVHSVVNYVPQRGFSGVVKASEEPISQSVIMCEKGSFNFTPLGRLYDVTLEIESEESPLEAKDSFQQKIGYDHRVELNCGNWGKNKHCLTGWYYYKNEDIESKFEFTNRKEIKNGKNIYEYVVTLASEKLRDNDYIQLQKGIIKNDPPQKTQF